MSTIAAVLDRQKRCEPLCHWVGARGCGEQGEGETGDGRWERWLMGGVRPSSGEAHQLSDCRLTSGMRGDCQDRRRLRPTFVVT